MSIWDLAKPVIAQVHGYCLAGGSELATGCDLVYVAEDAKMGYPAVRFGVPDMHFHAWFLGMRAAMEMMLTGDSISGVEAVRLGWANRAFPADRARRRGRGRGRAHRAAAARHRAAQQAHGAPADGHHGDARRRSGRAPSCARSARSSRASRPSSSACASRASRRRSRSATSPSATTAPWSPTAPPERRWLSRSARRLGPRAAGRTPTLGGRSIASLAGRSRHSPGARSARRGWSAAHCAGVDVFQS